MSIYYGDNERKLKINGIFLSQRGIQYSSRVLGQKRDRTSALLALYSG